MKSTLLLIFSDFCYNKKMAGACSKLNCNCQSYSKSLLTPGLCKECNHVKDSHNQFILHNDDDDLPDDDHLIHGNKDYRNLTQIGPTSTTLDYSSDENDHNKKDIYTQQIFKKKTPTNSLNHAESMWKNKYEQSQKEVEHWQKKYNDLYIKLIHSGEKQFQCPNCGKTFRQKQQKKEKEYQSN
eukprot:1005207_1